MLQASLPSSQELAGASHSALSKVHCHRSHVVPTHAIPSVRILVRQSERESKQARVNNKWSDVRRTSWMRGAADAEGGAGAVSALLAGNVGAEPPSVKSGGAAHLQASVREGAQAGSVQPGAAAGGQVREHAGGGAGAPWQPCPPDHLQPRMPLCTTTPRTAAISPRPRLCAARATAACPLAANAATLCTPGHFNQRGTTPRRCTQHTIPGSMHC